MGDFSYAQIGKLRLKHLANHIELGTPSRKGEDGGDAGKVPLGVPHDESLSEDVS
jgi:hypothetical protein